MKPFRGEIKTAFRGEIKTAFRGEIKTAMIKIEIESVDPLEFVKAMGEIHACLSHAGQPKPDMVILP